MTRPLMPAMGVITRRFALHYLAISAVATIIAILSLYLLVWRVQSPLLVFDVTSEQFSQRVVRPELTAFAITNAEVIGTTTCTYDGVFSGIVEAPSGSQLTYWWRPDRIAISIDVPEEGIVRFVQAGEVECRESAARITVRTASLDPTNPGWRLPIAGPAEVGSETVASVPGTDGRRRLDMLRSGSFEVFGRAFSLAESGTLFPISSSPITIPSGSRIGSLESAGDAAASWFGSAFHTSDGFEISATTEARSVSLFRPGADEQEEKFEFGIFASIAGDPNLGMIFLIVFIAVTTVQLVASWVGLWHRQEDS